MNKVGDAIMAVSYNKLWKLLVDKKNEQGRFTQKSGNCP